jgi:hypothetical protein
MIVFVVGGLGARGSHSNPLLREIDHRRGSGVAAKIHTTDPPSGNVNMRGGCPNQNQNTVIQDHESKLQNKEMILLFGFFNANQSL